MVFKSRHDQLDQVCAPQYVNTGGERKDVVLPI